jgi:hypothetical protein
METTERMKGITYEMGFVYCLFDKSFNVYKIGKTSDYPSKRNQQLFSTGMLYPLEYEFSIYIKNYSEIEKKIHEILDNYRVSPNREFFNIDKYTILKLFTENNLDGNIIIYQNNLDDYLNENKSKKRNFDEIKDIEMIDAKKRNFDEIKDIEMIDANTEYNNITKKYRKIIKLKNHFLNGQEIRHCIDNDIWIGIYNNDNDKIIYQGIKYSSITKFATAHYKTTPCKKNNCKSGMKECEYYNNDKWIFISTL